MEIKVGEYFRTENGKIHKWSKGRTYTGKNKIVKHSKNIIDLIEEDDFVNGCKVYENHKTYLTVYQKVKNSEVDYNYINHDEIKTILTHEQYEQNAYRLEEK